MGLVQVFVHFIGLVIATYFEAGSSVVDTVEDGMRAPLSHFGMNGAMQTLFVALVPILTMVVTIKFFNGPVRVIMVLGILGALFHITWPLVGDFVATV